MWADMRHLFISATMFLCPFHLYTGALRGLRIWQSHGDFGLLSKLEIKYYCLVYDFNIMRFISFTRGNHNLGKWKKKKVLAWNRVTPWKQQWNVLLASVVGCTAREMDFLFFYILAKPQKYHLIESLTEHTKYLLKVDLGQVFSTKTPSPFGIG